MAKSKSSSVIIVSFAIIGTLAILAGLWVRSMMSIPIVKIPTPVMPSPNAYDFYIKAANSIQDKNKISCAVANIKKQSESSTETDIRPYSLAEKEALLKRNAKALSLFHQGMGYKYMSPPDRDIFSTSRPRMRDLARLLALDAQVKAARGDWNGAMDSHTDAIQMGTDIPRGGELMTMLLGYAAEAIGHDDVWTTIDHLNADQARTAERRMEEINSRTVPFSDVLTEEKWAVMNDMALSPPGRSAPLPSGFSGIAIRNRQAFIGQYMDQLIANARKPYTANVPLPKAPGLVANILSFRGAQVAKMMGPVYMGARISHIKCEAMSKLLAVALALRAYKADHGNYPASLTDLTPSYLTKIPDDPFAMRGQLRYRLIGAKYVLYSVGPDGKDDGGKAIINLSEPVYRHYSVLSDSKGDIVAGINH